MVRRKEKNIEDYANPNSGRKVDLEFSGGNAVEVEFLTDDGKRKFFIPKNILGPSEESNRFSPYPGMVIEMTGKKKAKIAIFGRSTSKREWKVRHSTTSVPDRVIQAAKEAEILVKVIPLKGAAK